MATRKSITVRQPAAEGADVIYRADTRDYDMYVDGRYLGSRANGQDAWIEARATYFEAIEARATYFEAIEARATYFEAIEAATVESADMAAQAAGIDGER
jgi:hypothetical protein